jgi:hypothetical protein
MPRPERPLDAGPLSRFAAGLRDLRQGAGGMTYRAMAKEANYSATVLSEAAAGRRLPTLDVTLAYVRVCGGDTDEWTDRWHEAAGEQRADKPAAAPEAGDRRRRAPVALVVAAALVVTAVVLAVVLGGRTDEQRTVMPEDVVNAGLAVPDASPTDSVPPSGLPCSTHERALACVDLRQHLVWVKDMPPSDGHHAAVYWTTTTGGIQGECHNYLKVEGPWVTCPYADAVGEAATLGFRAAVVEEEQVLEWGPYVTLPVPE